MIFIGLDFFFHASLLKTLWTEPVTAIKSNEELFKLIPAGYASFFVLTLLTGYLFFRIFPGQTTRKESFLFGLIFGGLFAVTNFLGLYSYVNIPLKQLLVFNLVYLIEILGTVYIFDTSKIVSGFRQLTIFTIIALALLIIMGVIIQSFLMNS